SSRRRHTRSKRDWSSDVCSSDLKERVCYLKTSCTFEEVFQHTDTPPMQLPGQPVSEVVYSRSDYDGYRWWTTWHDGPGKTTSPRSEERRVGKEGRAGWWMRA